MKLRVYTLTLIIIFGFSFEVQSQSLGRFGRGMLGLIGDIAIEFFFGSDGDDARINEINCRVTNLEDRVGRIEGEIHVINSKIANINQSINSLDLRVSDIEEFAPHGAFGLGYGLSKFNDITFHQMKSQTTISLGYAELGLNLNVNNLNIPDNINLERTENTLNNIVDHLRVGYKDGPAYLKVGRVSSHGFGHHFLFRGYKNNLNYDEPDLGFEANINHTYAGISMLSSNLTNNGVSAGRVYARPLIPISKESSLPFWFAQFGFSYIKDGYENKDDRIFNAFDVQIPIFRAIEDGQLGMASLFGNYAKVKDGGRGYGLGISGEYTGTSIGVGLWYEIKDIDRNFITGYFDAFHDLGRFDNNWSAKKRLNDKNFHHLESTFGFDFTCYGLSIIGYYVEDLSKDPNTALNYGHLEAAIKIPFEMSDDIGIIGVNFVLDQRNITKFSDLNIINALSNNGPNVLISFNASVNVPLGNNMFVFAKYANRDYIQFLQSGLDKAKTSTALFGMQYNWGYKSNSSY